MSGKTELFIFMAAALATIGGLVTAQVIFVTYRDVASHEALNHVPENPELMATRAAERSALETAPMPIAEAKRAIGERGRTAFEAIASQPSDDYSALSGWVHAKNFKPFVAPTLPAASAEPATPAEAVAPGAN